jgi:predicted ATPase
VTRRGRAVQDAFVRSVTLMRERIEDPARYPFNIPAVRALDELELHPGVTFFVGENGCGKSTLVEAIAVAAGFNPEGGTRNFRFSTRASESVLHRALRLVRGARRPDDGFFLRAESLFNVATEIERLDVAKSYGGVSLHEQSHGASFLAIANERWSGDGLYILDEPEAALSPNRQLSFLVLMDELVRRRRSQFIIATHSALLMAYPHAVIYRLDGSGIAAVPYEDTEHFRVTRDFLNGRERFFRELFDKGVKFSRSTSASSRARPRRRARRGPVPRRRRSRCAASSCPRGETPPTSSRGDRSTRRGGSSRVRRRPSS